MKPDDITRELHKMWANLQANCKEQRHLDRKEHWLNYAHVQQVRMCDACFKRGQIRHTELFKKLQSMPESVQATPEWAKAFNDSITVQKDYKTMRDRELMIAREETKDLLVHTLREMILSMILLMLATVLAGIFFPFVLNALSGLVLLLVGFVLGAVVGAKRAYIIFWENKQTTYQKSPRRCSYT